MLSSYYLKKIGTVVKPSTLLMSTQQQDIGILKIIMENYNETEILVFYSIEEIDEGYFESVTLADVQTIIEAYTNIKPEVITVIIEKSDKGFIYKYGNKSDNNWYCDGITQGYNS